MAQLQPFLVGRKGGELLTAHADGEVTRRRAVLGGLLALAQPALHAEDHRGPADVPVAGEDGGHGQRRGQRRAEVGGVALAGGLLVGHDYRRIKMSALCASPSFPMRGATRLMLSLSFLSWLLSAGLPRSARRMSFLVDAIFGGISLRSFGDVLCREGGFELAMLCRADRWKEVSRRDGAEQRFQWEGELWYGMRR